MKKDDPPIQFLELDTWKLKQNGMCVIVLPYGEFFSGSSYSKTRDHFMKTVNITDIILVPGGIFTHTGIKTCVLVYQKNSEGTKQITFSKINQDCNKIEKITTVTIEDIRKEPNLSWYHTDYLLDSYVQELIVKMPNYDWVEFGEIFELEKGKIQSSKVEEDDEEEDEEDENMLNNENKVLFITKAEINEKSKKIISDNYYNGGIFMAQAFNGNGKCPIRYTNEKCIHSNLMYNLKLNSKYKNKVHIKYIYYFLMNMKEHIEITYNKGACNQSLDSKNFSRMKIPVPSIESQAKLVKQLDSSNEKVFYMRKIIDSMKEDIVNFYCMDIEIANRNKETKWVEFGEVFELEKGKIQSSIVDEDEDGDGVMITQSKNTNDYKKIKNWKIDGENIFIGNIDSGKKFCLSYYNGKCDYTNLM